MASSHSTIAIKTHSSKETRKLGQELGRLIERPTTLALIGDLGGGKTAFVQGLARGLDVPGDYYITSPTFTLINEYPGRLPLFHVDLYRLETVDDLEDIGLEELLDDRGVLAIEWADKLAGRFFAEYLSLKFETIDDTSRRISLIACGHNETNLIKALEMRMKN
jgi:tRNA threonylcarbamoyladenosine biosynthesis protein TsaE